MSSASAFIPPTRCADIQLGRAARERGAFVVFGGIHATLFPDEVREHGAAHAVVTGDGDLVWPNVLRDCERNAPQPHYDGGRVGGDDFLSARWDLLSADRYMWASVQTVRGCPKHCSFCSVWRTDGQTPRQRHVDAVISELVTLRRKGFRFIVLADDNFYPVPLADLAAADRRADKSRYAALSALRQERFELMAQMAKLPDDMVLLHADHHGSRRRSRVSRGHAPRPDPWRARRRGIRHAGRAEGGLQELQRGGRRSGHAAEGVSRGGRHVLGSFIFGLPTDTPETFAATADLAQRAEVSFAQFVMLTPLPGTLDFAKWEREATDVPAVGGVPLTRYWLIPSSQRPKVYPPADVRGRNPRAHAASVGPVLRNAGGVGAFGLRAIAPRPRRLRPHLETVPGRCTRIPASPPTVRASSAQRGAHGGWRERRGGCS